MPGDLTLAHGLVAGQAHHLFLPDGKFRGGLAEKLASMEGGTQATISLSLPSIASFFSGCEDGRALTFAVCLPSKQSLTMLT